MIFNIVLVYRRLPFHNTKWKEADKMEVEYIQVINELESYRILLSEMEEEIQQMIADINMFIEYL